MYEFLKNGESENFKNCLNVHKFERSKYTKEGSRALKEFIFCQPLF